MRCKRECNAEPRGVDTSISSIQSGSKPLEDDFQAMALLTVPLTPIQQEERGEGGDSCKVCATAAWLEVGGAGLPLQSPVACK